MMSSQGRVGPSSKETGVIRRVGETRTHIEVRERRAYRTASRGRGPRTASHTEAKGRCGADSCLEPSEGTALPVP